jgi:hypothetical protein
MNKFIEMMQFLEWKYKVDNMQKQLDEADKRKRSDIKF